MANDVATECNVLAVGSDESNQENRRIYTTDHAIYVAARHIAAPSLTTLCSAVTNSAAQTVVTYGKAPAKITMALYGTSGAVSVTGCLQFTDDPYAASAPSVAQWHSTKFTLSGTGVGTTRGTHAPAWVVSTVIDYPWKYWRINTASTIAYSSVVGSISGTGASLDAYIGL